MAFVSECVSGSAPESASRLVRVEVTGRISRILVIVMWTVTACAPGGAGDDWVAVKRDDLVLSVELTGSLRAVESDVAGPPMIPGTWDFKIARMGSEGKEVKAGELVLAFDTSDLVRQLQEKMNERDAAMKQLEKRRLDMKMARRDAELALAEAETDLRKTDLKAKLPADLTGALELRSAELDLELSRQKVEHLRKRAGHSKRRDNADLPKCGTSGAGRRRG